VNVSFKKSFFKDRERLPDNYRDKVDQLVFEVFPVLNRLSELSSIKAIKGYPGYFRARIGEWDSSCVQIQS
jgi:mRNA-degrading endonuclease RelE of RelBE toxin-antitoxin system